MRALPCRLGSLRSRVWTSAARGPRILALHGFTGSGADFDALVPALRLAAPDLPGHGACQVRSARAADMERTVAALVGLASQLSAEVLLGYSMGGRTALTLALRRPSRWRALILVGASPGLGDPIERSQRRAGDEELARRIEREGVERFQANWAEHPLIATQSRIQPTAYAGMQRRRALNRSAGLAASLRGMGTGAMKPLWTRLHELELPVLLLAGQDDSKYCAIALRMHAALPNSTVEVVPGAGHCAHLEAPAAALESIERFLSRALRS